MNLFTPYPECREIILNTRTEKTFRGVLWRRRRGYLVLRNAFLLQPQGGRAPLDGEVVIDRANVDFIQVV